MDNAAIYYIFDRDDHSNTDSDFISAQIVRLVNSRENPDYDRQGMLLLSYPSIESFTLMNFISDSINLSFDTGESLKRYLHTEKINHQKIDINTLNKAAEELIKSLHTINSMYNVDEMSECNTAVYEFEESGKILSQKYRAFSLFVIALIDLGIIEIE